MIRTLPLLLLTLVAIAPATADAPSLDAIEALLDVERTQLDDELARFEQVRSQRTATLARLASLYRSLDAALPRGERDGEAEAERRPEPDYELLLAQLAEAEGDRAAAFEVERQVLASLRDRMRRIELLREKRDERLGRVPAEPGGALSGRWTLSMLPVEQRGVWRLEQSGAVVNGTYELDGGWSGSLQGTLVNRKVFLLRIDSKLGKVMEYEGFLSADGDTIRGTWLNYELAGAEGSTGHFAAERQSGE